MASGESVDGVPEFGPLLRRRRAAAELTQEALAEAAGVSARAVRALEGGERRAPHRDTVRRLTGALSLSADERAELAAAGARRPARRGAALPPAPGPGALPAPLTPLVGREREVGAIRARLGPEGVRLLTLTGPGGVGKTRLALHAAAGLGPTDGAPGCWLYPDGVRLAALAPLGDPALVPQAVAAAVGVREAPGRPLVDTLADALRPRRLLLVLDNCEHLLPGAAPVVAALLAACPGLAVLATSRGALRLSGEHEYPVPPLRLPAPPDPARPPDPAALSRCEAVALFAQRAAAVRPDFALTVENAPAVADICRRLDGLPLAIELAAAQVRVLPPRALLARLAGRLAVLVGGPRDAPARQQTLRATLDWSHDLLDEGERVLFRRLAVFAGGGTVDAAEAVCGGPDGPSPGALHGLGRLVDAGLLRPEEPPDGDPRVGMLETVREYALERLEASGEAERVRRRHAGIYLALAERAAPELVGPAQGVWLGRLEAEHDNLRAALAWASAACAAAQDRAGGLRLAGALGRFWEVRGHLTEGLRWLERLAPALGAGDPAPPGARAKACLAAGVLAYQQGNDPEAARAHLERGLALFRAAGDGNGVAACLDHLGGVARERDDDDRAQALYAQGLALRRALGDRPGTAASLGHLGRLAAQRGDRRDARPLLEESLALRRALGDRGGVATALGHLGRVALDEGDPATARALLEEALTGFRELGDRGGAAMSLGRLAAVAEAQGDPHRAEALLEESLGLLRDLGRTREVAFWLRHLGRLALRRGDPGRAAALLAESLALSRAFGDEPGVAGGVAALAGVAAADGRPERAARLLAAVADRLDARGTPLHPAERADYDRALAAARAHHDDGAISAAWASGQAMTLEQAVAYALEEAPEGAAPAGEGD